MTYIMLKYKNISKIILTSNAPFPGLCFGYNDNFHTSSYILSTPRQIGNAMNKVLGNRRKKRVHYVEAVQSSPNEFNKSPIANRCLNSRRSVVLNKLFMRNITDLMSSGEYTAQILGLGVEVNEVKITHDYKILKIYWTAKSSKLEEAEKILQKSAGILRHDLSTLRVMGHVPKIQFVKDKNYEHLEELNNRLSIADYGEEGPSNIDPAAHFISELELSVSIDKNIKDEIAKLEEQNPYEMEELQLTEVPPMTNYVFNLDQDAIIKRIKSASTKTRNNHIDVDDNWANFKLKQYSNSESLTLDNAQLQRDAFNKFLQQRQVLKKKEKIRNSNNLDIVLTQEEKLADGNIHFYENTDDDYILEDEETNIK